MTDNRLKFSANLDRDQLLTSQTKSVLSCQVKIDSNVITGAESELATTANICLLFDCSYSMQGKKFETAINTAKMIVDILHERHWISLLAFQTRCNTVFKNAVPTEDEKESIKNQIENIKGHFGGSTNLAAGINKAVDVLAQSTADADVIILLSDGKADSAKKAIMAAENASQKGIQIFAVGIGESYNADQLLDIVTPSNGAIFGDSEGDKINDIFHHIINRIDQIFASKAKIDFTFDEYVRLQQVFKTSPERALYNSLTINSDHKLELQVGNIENNKSYEFLMQLEVDSHDIGAVELIKARLQYDINHEGIIKQQVQEIILTVTYTEDDTQGLGTSKKITRAIKSANMIQHCNEVLEAYSSSDNARAIQAIDELQKKCTEENNAELPKHLDSLKIKLDNGYGISDKDRNDFLLAATVAPPKVEVPPKVEALPDVQAAPDHEALPDADAYDFILVDPGPETIRLLREIRNTTNMEIPEIAAVIKSRNSRVTIFNNKADAEDFQKRLINIGAKVKIQPSTGVE